MDLVTLVGAVVGGCCFSVAGLLAVVAFLWWFFREAPPDPRYLADRADPVRAWSHGVIALYRGDVGDPGYLTVEEADRQLSGWSCPRRADLDALIERYRAGESSPGWDIARLVFLARLGAARGDYSPEESWAHVALARARAHADISDWAAFAQAIEEGKSEWYEGSDELPEQLAAARRVRQWAEASVLPHVPYR